MTPPAAALTSSPRPAADDGPGPAAASTELFETIDLADVRSCLEADAAAVLIWLSDHAAGWAATDQDRAALSAVLTRR